MKIILDKQIKDKVIDLKNKATLKKKFGPLAKKITIITVPKDKKNV